MERKKKITLKMTVMLYVLMFLYAIFTTVPGTQLVVLTREFGMELAEGGIFTVAVNGGCILGILASVFFLDRCDGRRLVLVSYLLFGVFLVVMRAAGSCQNFLVLLTLAGAGMKFFDASVNVCIAKLNPGDSGFYMNLLHCSFGIGAFAGPVFATGLTGLGFQWRETYLCLGAAALVLCLVYARLQKDCPPLASRLEKEAREGADDTDGVKADGEKAKGAERKGENAEGVEKEGAASVFSFRVLCLMGILLCYCGHQMGINSWLPAYLQEDLHMPAGTAALGVSAFWVGLIFSRLISAVLTKYLRAETILACGLLLGAGFLLPGILSGHMGLTIVGVVGAGLFAGASIPLTLTIGYDWFPGKTGVISTLLFLCIAGGAVVVPWLMGWCVKVSGLYMGMTLDGASLLAAAGIAAVVWKNGRKWERRRGEA